MFFLGLVMCLGLSGSLEHLRFSCLTCVAVAAEMRPVEGVEAVADGVS